MSDGFDVWRSRLLVLAAVLLCVSICACGAARQDTRSAASIAAARMQPLGDEDRDNHGNLSYLDGDDGSVRYLGRAASPREAQVIAALVRRYYAAAAAGDATRACGLLYYIVEESLPEEYGRPPGPPYLSGADSCEAVLSRVFARFHAQLALAPTVTGVRVEGDHADALLGWTKLGAGFIEVKREGDVWKIDTPLATALP
jgi:hypothetical protein